MHALVVGRPPGQLGQLGGGGQQRRPGYLVVSAMTQHRRYFPIEEQHHGFTDVAAAVLVVEPAERPGEPANRFHVRLTDWPVTAAGGVFVEWGGQPPHGWGEVRGGGEP